MKELAPQRPGGEKWFKKKEQQIIWPWTPPDIRKKTRIYVLATPIQHCSGNSSQGIQSIKSDKSHPDWKV